MIIIAKYAPFLLPSLNVDMPFLVIDSEWEVDQIWLPSTDNIYIARKTRDEKEKLVESQNKSIRVKGSRGKLSSICGWRSYAFQTHQ